MPTVSTVPASPGKSRQEAWREKFQEFASKPPEEMGDEWGLFLKELGLTHGHYLAVCEVLKQRRWATAKYPRAYVIYAATIEARKMHLSIPHKDDTLEFGKSPLVFMGGDELDRGTTRKGIEAALDSEDREHGAARPKRLKGKHYVAEQFSHEAYEKEEMALEEAANSGPFWPSDCWIMQPYWVKAHDGIHDVAVHTNQRDWRKVGERAGLDPWEFKVLEYRRQGTSRDKAMKRQPDEGSRKAIQAAWKSMDRTGWSKVRRILSEKAPEDVPEELPMNTRKIGACAPPHPRSAISGNPLQSAWKRTGGTSRGDLGRFLIKYRGRGPYQFADARLVRILDSECPE